MRTLFLVFASYTAAWDMPGRLPHRYLSRRSSAPSLEPGDHVIEHVIGQLETGSIKRELSTGSALALGTVPNVVLGMAFVLGWEDEPVRLAGLAALLLRFATWFAAGRAAPLSRDSWISGPLAVVRAMYPRVKSREPLVLGKLNRPGLEPAVISSLEFVAHPETKDIVADFLKAYYAAAADQLESLLITQPAPNVFSATMRFVNERTDDRTLEMRCHHTSDAFLELVEGCRPFLATSIAIYLVDQNHGKLGNPRHPFGPGGEGGRDDAIYSSPANLDGSQVGSKIGVEAARSVEF